MIALAAKPRGSKRRAGLDAELYYVSGLLAVDSTGKAQTDSDTLGLRLTDSETLPRCTQTPKTGRTTGLGGAVKRRLERRRHASRVPVP